RPETVMPRESVPRSRSPDGKILDAAVIRLQDPPADVDIRPERPQLHHAEVPAGRQSHRTGASFSSVDWEPCDSLPFPARQTGASWPRRAETSSPLARTPESPVVHSWTEMILVPESFNFSFFVLPQKVALADHWPASTN